MIVCPKGCPFAMPTTGYGARVMRNHQHRRHGAPRPPSAGRRVPCPHCKADVGVACMTPAGLRLGCTHKERLIASAQARTPEVLA